ncbi:MAG TPA: hypothetical protein VKZ48_02760 [Burkholderiales bacterium]|nr:hypothetical protein [Burkholderiales bacterium]
MVAWVTLLKAGLPYVAEVVVDRLPAFTKRGEGANNTAELTAQQIAELQQAARHNAESIKAVAEQLQQTVKAIETGAQEQALVIEALRKQVADMAEQRDNVTKERDVLRRRIEAARWVSLIAFGTAFLALSLSIFSNIA